MTNLPSSTFTIFGALGLLFAWGFVLVSRKKNKKPNKRPNKAKLTNSVLQASEIIIEQDKKIEDLNAQLNIAQDLILEFTIKKGIVNDCRINEFLNKSKKHNIN